MSSVLAPASVETHRLRWRWVVDWILCLSAASLFFANAWSELHPGAEENYREGIRISLPAICGLWTNILLLAALLMVVHAIMRRSRWHARLALLGGIALAASLALPTSRMLSAYFPWLLPSQIVRSIGKWPTLGLVVVFAGGLGWVAFRKANQCRRLLRGLLLILAPVPVLFSWVLIRAVAPAHPAPPEIPAVAPRPLRAVVVIFDEWDYEYAFPARPAWIHLSELDRFAAECTTYSHCWPPAGETLRSIPSLATGRLWSGAVFSANGEVRLKDPTSGEWTSWTKTEDLFRQLPTFGWRTRMIQWLHAIPDEFRDQRPGLSISHYPDSPEWERARIGYQSYGATLTHTWHRVYRSFRAYYRLVALPNLVPNRIAMVEEMEKEVVQAASSRQYDLLWAHLPVPHAPAIWDAHVGTYLSRFDPKVSNLDNMVLADRILGRLRRQMEAQGDWDNALVILTGDHWQRQKCGENLPPNPHKYKNIMGYRVPLLVKLPRQRMARIIEEPQLNIRIRRLIESMAKGQALDVEPTAFRLPADLWKQLLEPQTD